ncbi:hypothetical protein FRC03_003393 [Tulasnella sp. 419]|nr:hypothetical protein FRC03_003393 [Tulasnella sp. 419]
MLIFCDRPRGLLGQLGDDLSRWGNKTWNQVFGKSGVADVVDTRKFQKLDELNGGYVKISKGKLITWKTVLIGGTVITLPVALFAFAQAGNAASQVGDTTETDPELYIRENPTNAHELIKFLRSRKDVDQREVDKLEKIANGVAPQGAKRSLLDLD